MNYIEVTGKTVDDAITEACRKLEITSDKLEYEVIEKGSAGFLGFGNKPAVIKARVKNEEVEEVLEEIKEKIEVLNEEKKAVSKTSSSDAVNNDPKVFLSNVFKAMDMEVNISVEKNDNEMNIELSGDDMGVLIGKRGQTLDSLQYLTSLYVNKGSDSYVRVKVDTENYRKRRRDTLENLAKNIAYKVKRTRKPVTLEPMNPYERRIIHAALQNDKYVSTHSEGEEPYRRVVITYNK